MDYREYLENVRGVRYVAEKFGYSTSYVRLLCNMGRIVADKDPDSTRPESHRPWRIVVPSMAYYVMRQEQKRSERLS